MKREGQRHNVLTNQTLRNWDRRVVEGRQGFQDHHNQNKNYRKTHTTLATGGRFTSRKMKFRHYDMNEDYDFDEDVLDMVQPNPVDNAAFSGVVVRPRLDSESDSVATTGSEEEFAVNMDDMPPLVDPEWHYVSNNEAPVEPKEDEKESRGWLFGLF